LSEVNTERIVRQFAALRDHSHALWGTVARQHKELKLPEVGMALEHMTDTLEYLWQMLGPLEEGTLTGLRDRWVKEDPDHPAVNPMDDVLVNLGISRDSVMVSRHLVGLARGKLLVNIEAPYPDAY
jgi:hypothetical protein